MEAFSQSPGVSAHWGLYLLSGDAAIRKPDYFAFLDGALDAGLRIVQLRAKTLDEETILEAGSLMRRLTRSHGATFIVNDRAETAMRLDADGVHVGQDDMEPAAARRIVGRGKIVGLSTHNRLQIEAAQSEPVDYIGVGPVFPTRSKANADPTTGLELLRWAREHSRLPVVAIGGITLENLESVLATGVGNLAVISAIEQAPDPLGAAKTFIERIRGTYA